MSTPALDHLARRVTSDPMFLASQMHAYQTRHGLTDADLAERLGCPVEVLARVRLCGAIRADRFAENCRVVACKFGLKVEALEDVCWPW